MWTLLRADVGGSGKFSSTFSICHFVKQRINCIQGSNMLLDVPLGLCLRAFTVVERSYDPRHLSLATANNYIRCR